MPSNAFRSMPSLVTLMPSSHLFLARISNKVLSMHLCICMFVFCLMQFSEPIGSINIVGKGIFKDIDTTATTNVQRNDQLLSTGLKFMSILSTSKMGITEVAECLNRGIDKSMQV